MRREDLVDLTVFMAVAEECSFTRAAIRLGVSQSTLSHTVRRLETRLGFRLLTRTTRSVAVTQAGERLLAKLTPALAELDDEIISLGELRDVPSGTIRITTSKHAATTVIWPKLTKVLHDYPDVHVELTLDSGFADVVSGRFDAGVRLGEALAKDMIAVPIGPDLRMAAVGSPAYFKRHPAPMSPHQLAQHRCINQRTATAGDFYGWEFEQDGREMRVRVEGQLAFNDEQMIVSAAIDGYGIAFVMEDFARQSIENGSLIRVLKDWCAPFAGYHLYYPSRRQPSAAFTVIVKALREGSPK